MARQTPSSGQYALRQYREVLDRVAANALRLRDAVGWSQEEAAYQCLGMPTRLYQLVESAQTNLTATTLARLSHGFQVDVSELLVPASPRPRRRRGRPRKIPSPPKDGPPTA